MACAYTPHASQALALSRQREVAPRHVARARTRSSPLPHAGGRERTVSEGGPRGTGGRATRYRRMATRRRHQAGNHSLGTGFSLHSAYKPCDYAYRPHAVHIGRVAMTSLSPPAGGRGRAAPEGGPGPTTPTVTEAKTQPTSGHAFAHSPAENARWERENADHEHEGYGHARWGRENAHTYENPAHTKTKTPRRHAMPHIAHAARGPQCLSSDFNDSNDFDQIKSV